MRVVENLNRALHKIMEGDSRVYVIGEDILDPYGGAFKVTKGLSTKFPERVITTPISEGAIVGFASGMALEGFVPIVEIMFGDFITLCADQIINGAAKFDWMYNEQVSMNMVVRTPMGGRRGYGPTHSQTLEAMFLNVPHIRIVAPSIFHDPGYLLEKSLRTKGPVLFIENKTQYTQQVVAAQSGAYISNYNVFMEYDIAKHFPTIKLSFNITQPAVTVIAYGGIVEPVCQAAREAYLEEECHIEIIIPSSIKPIPIEEIMKLMGKHSNVLIVEENPSAFGWGAELASQIYEFRLKTIRKPILRIGAKSCPIPSSRQLEQDVLPQKEDILKGIIELSKG